MSEISKTSNHCRKWAMKNNKHIKEKSEGLLKIINDFVFPRL